MRTILVVGIGAGDPDHLTVAAVNALRTVDVVVVLDKGSRTEQLTRLRAEICRRYITDRAYRVVEVPDPQRDRTAGAYAAAVADWHDRRAAVLEAALLAEVGPDQTAAFLVWGDPGLYDSTIRVLRRILDRAAVTFDWTVIPGVTSVAALTAAHRIPLNGVGEPVLLTTGRRLDPTDVDGTVVVMLDGDLACRAIDDPAVDIYWGADLGTADEQLRSGRLVDVIDEIAAVRAESRARKGWLMDTYLLRRRRT